MDFYHFKYEMNVKIQSIMLFVDYLHLMSLGAYSRRAPKEPVRILKMSKVGHILGAERPICDWGHQALRKELHIVCVRSLGGGAPQRPPAGGGGAGR